MTQPPRDHKITLAEAKALLGRRRATAGERGGHFPREAIDAILAQPGCTGIRFYHGMNPDGTSALILVGVNSTGGDMTDGLLIDNHYPCPPYCDVTSVLG